MATDAAQMFPRLTPSARLKRLEPFALVHDWHPSHVLRLHPSHALLLSLCTGGHSLAEIAEVFAATYRLSSAEAAETANAVLARAHFAVEMRENRDADAEPRFDPFTFLYNGDSRFTDADDIDLLAPPAGVNLTLTFACNFACVYCYQNLSDRRGRLDLRNCLALVDDAADLGAVFIGLTGGEPTLFPVDVVVRILERGMIPILSTNGTMIGRDRRISQRLAAAGMEQMTVSLDTADPALHDEMTRSSGTFSQVIDGIRFLVDAGVRVTVKCVLTPMNADHIGGLVDFAADLGVSEIGVSYLETGARGSPANSIGNVTAAQVAAVCLLLTEKQAALGRRCVVHRPRASECQWDDTAWYPCGGLSMGMSVFPNGDVTVCDKVAGVEELTYGNVFDASLRKIWYGDRFREVRDRAADPRRVAAECAACSKLRLCRTSCFVDSFCATGDYFAKHPKCGVPFH